MPKGRDLVLTIVAIVLIVAVVGFVVDRLFLAPGRAKKAVATANTEATVSKGEANKASDARAITETRSETIRTIERQTITNERLIRAAPGAGDAVAPDLDRAGRAALCLRHAYRADPACQQLPRPDTEGVVGGDTGRAPAG